MKPNLVVSMPPKMARENKRLREKNALLLGRLRAMEWEGYDAEAGERACPNCGAWKYQHGRKRPIHAYACALASLIGAPMETPEGMDRGEFWGSGHNEAKPTPEE